MAVTYVTLYPPGGNTTTVQVAEGSQLHVIYADMGFSATPSVPGTPVRPDPFPQYVHDDEVGALLGAAQDSAVAALVDDSGSATGGALRAAFDAWSANVPSGAVATVEHGGDANAVRPNVAVVTWRGWVQPNAMTAADRWEVIAEPVFNPLTDLPWEAVFTADALGLANGATFTTWNDSSGHNYTASLHSTATVPPTYVAARAEFNNQPVVAFDRSPLQTPQFATNLAQPHSMVLVGRSTTTPASNIYFTGSDDNSTTTRAGLFKTSALKWRMSAGTSLEGSVTADAAPHLFEAVYNSSGSKLRVDNTLVASGNAGTDQRNRLTIGSRAQIGQTAERLFGDIAFVGVLPREMTTYERDKFKTWVGTKYGLTLA